MYGFCDHPPHLYGLCLTAAPSVCLQQGRLGPTPPGSSAGGLPGLPPAPGGRFGDGSAEQERIIRDSIHRLYQSIEPAGHKPEPPAAAAAARPGYPTPDYLSPYYDHM